MAFGYLSVVWRPFSGLWRPLSDLSLASHSYLDSRFCSDRLGGPAGRPLDQVRPELRHHDEDLLISPPHGRHPPHLRLHHLTRIRILRQPHQEQESGITSPGHHESGFPSSSGTGPRSSWPAARRTLPPSEAPSGLSSGQHASVREA